MFRQNFRKHSVYINVDYGKSSIYSNKKECLLVPHQDDDINLLGGVIDEYIKYGSDIYVIYATNGDYYGHGDIRLEESHRVSEAYGIPQENLIFMGYSDSGIYPIVLNIYNNPDSQTRYKFCNGLDNILLNIKPDIIFCNNYNSHADHSF